MTEKELQTLIEDATLDFTLGDNETALEKLTRATEEHPESFDAWHALTEVHFESLCPAESRPCPEIG